MTASQANNRPRFRILSLDGGGIRGAFAAACLSRLEAELRRPITDSFDLITGTSTGGIIALALGLGEPAEKIREFYKERGAAIFTPREPISVPKWQQVCLSVAKWKFPGFDEKTLHRSKYPQEPLKSALHEVYGDRTLEQVDTCRLVIPAVDLIQGRTITF